MTRLRFTVVVLGLMALGCARNSPPSPTPVAATDAAPASTGSPSAATPAVPTAVAEQSAPKSLFPNESSPLRQNAAALLEYDGQGGWRKNEKAATELEKLSAEDIARLWPLLKDPQVEVRRGAAVVLLSVFDPNQQQQVAAFTDLLRDEDAMVRARGLDAIRQLSPAEQVGALPRLVAMLDAKLEQRVENRAAVARLCGSLKGEATASFPALAASAESDPDAKVRSAALAAIAQIGSTEIVVSPLSKGLKDADPSVRLVAAARLRQMGSGASAATKELSLALADANSDVAEAAAETLIRVGPGAVKSLSEVLSSKSTPARKLALACLARIGLAAKPAVGEIEKCRQDADPQVRQLAETALKRIVGQ